MTLITRDDYKFGHNLTISCNQGYSVEGFKNITCSNDSTWMPALPNCVSGIVTDLFRYFIAGIFRGLKFWRISKFLFINFCDLILEAIHYYNTHYNIASRIDYNVAASQLLLSLFSIFELSFQVYTSHIISMGYDQQ